MQIVTGNLSVLHWRRTRQQKGSKPLIAIKSLVYGPYDVQLFDQPLATLWNYRIKVRVANE